MTAPLRTYLDHNATAPLRPEARTAMLSALDLVGNASSVHAEGRRARGLVEDAREHVAALVGAKPEEVVFTCSATEANNWVIRSAGTALLVGAIEHDSVLAPARAVDPTLIELPCDASGMVDITTLLEITAPNGSLLSLQFANSETGVVQPITQAIEAARRHDLRVHCDAVQALGRIPIDFAALGLDFMSLSAHKLGGPKGAGALVIRDGLDVAPLLAGGGQERRRRSGTENVAAIAGFGAAARAARAGLIDAPKIKRLRDRLEAAVAEITPDAVVVGANARRLPNTSCIALPGAAAATLLIRLDLAGIAVSAGSACSSGKIGGSHVLAAMGIEAELAAAAIRISLGHDSTEADIERFITAWRAIGAGRTARQSHPDSAGAASRLPRQTTAGA